jgi:hypothetical protein
VLETTEAEEGTAEVEEGKVDVAAPFPADGQASMPIEPGEGALDDPAVTSEALAGLDPRARDPGGDAARAEGAAVRPGSVRFVRMEFGGATTRPAGLPSRPADGLDSLDQGREERAVVDIRRREPDREWGALAVDHPMPLGARFAPIRRIRADVLAGGSVASAPPLAGTVALSALTRDQSIWSASPRRSSKVVCSRCQTPAACQSRSRRQQVIPLPQPIS